MNDNNPQGPALSPMGRANLFWLVRVAGSWKSYIETIYLLQVQGFPDLDGRWNLSRMQSFDGPQFIASIPDTDLHRLFESLYDQSQKIIKCGAELTAEVARFVRLPPPHTPRDIQKLKSRLR